MRRSLYLTCVLVALLATNVSLLVSAQATLGHLHGIIRAASGGPLAGVTVSIARADGLTRTTTSDAKGEFVFRDLPPGAYTITTTLASFGLQRTSVTVTASRTAEVTLTLSPERSRDENRVMPVPTAPAPPPPPRQIGPITGGIVGGLEAAPPAVKAYGSGTGGGVYRPDFNTEAYDKIDDNRWTLVSNRPLSTFSTDVDTASYANVRRFLNQGQLPPKDAVRVEELINYFGYEYPEPSAEAPFSVTTSLGPCPWDPKHQLALIGLQARHIDRGNTPPRNLVFLIDVSGSMMSPNKLPLVKASLAMLARNLTSRDRIALVVYAGAAGLVLPSTSGGDPTAILEALNRLQAGGSTNGAGGITLAYETARHAFIKGGVNRVVLATDGDFNVGVTNQGDLIRMIEENRETGISLSVLGFGMGNLKDSTMEKLADRGNGNYSYIDSLTEAQKVLVDEAGGTLVTVAKDVKLQIEFNPRVVGAYRLVGYENRLLQDQDFNDDKKDAGDMGAGHSVTALYELVPAGEATTLPGVDPLKYQRPAAPTRAAASAELMTVKLRYKKPDGDTSALISVPVTTRAQPTAALGFAAAVAEFGMLLRDSEFKGTASYEQAWTLASQNKGADPHGHRAEFARLVKIAESLNDLKRSRPRSQD